MNDDFLTIYLKGVEDEKDKKKQEIDMLERKLYDLQEENKQLKEENAKLNPLQGIFAPVNDDMLLRSCGFMQQEIDNYEKILAELEETIENKIKSFEEDKDYFIDEKDMYELANLIQELKEKYK